MKKIRKKFNYLALMLAVALFLSMGSSVFALDGTIIFTADSAKQSISGHNMDVVAFETSGGYVGSCKQFGEEHSTSGTASVTRIPNNYNIAKAAYYFGVVQGWEQYLGTTDSRGATLQCIIQDLNGSIDEVINNPGEWVPSFVEFAQLCKQRSQNALNAYAWESVQVPDSFECYACQPGDGSQSFILWKGEANGGLRLKKASANTGITG